jgi:hypothetical protein
MGRRGCERSVRLPEERDKPAALDVGQCALQDVGYVGEVLQARQTRPGDLRDDDVGRVRLALERDEIGAAIVCKTGPSGLSKPPRIGSPDTFWPCSRPPACRQRGNGHDRPAGAQPRLSGMRRSLPFGDADGPEDLRGDPDLQPARMLSEVQPGVAVQQAGLPVSIAGLRLRSMWAEGRARRTAVGPKPD